MLDGEPGVTAALMRDMAGDAGAEMSWCGLRSKDGAWAEKGGGQGE